MRLTMNLSFFVEDDWDVHHALKAATCYFYIYAGKPCCILTSFEQGFLKHQGSSSQHSAFMAPLLIISKAWVATRIFIRTGRQLEDRQQCQEADEIDC